MVGDLFSASLEDADERNRNVGAFVVQWNIAPASFTWVDPPAMYHGDVSTQSYADGHAAFQKWRHPAIISAGRRAANGQAPAFAGAPTTGPDYEFVRNNYQHPNWR